MPIPFPSQSFPNQTPTKTTKAIKTRPKNSLLNQCGLGPGMITKPTIILSQLRTTTNHHNEPNQHPTLPTISDPIATQPTKPTTTRPLVSSENPEPERLPFRTIDEAPRPTQQPDPQPQPEPQPGPQPASYDPSTMQVISGQLVPVSGTSGVKRAGTLSTDLAVATVTGGGG